MRVSSIYKPMVVGLNAPFRATPGKLKTDRSFSGRIRCQQLMTESRPPLYLAMVLAGILLGTVFAVVLFLPLWRCASCDRATWKRVYPNAAANGYGRNAPAECEICGQSGRMSLRQRWSYLKDLQKAGFHPGYPLIP